MLKRTLAVLLFSVLASAAAATAQPPSWSDLHATSMLHLDKLPPWIEESRRFAEYQHAALQAAKQWLVEHSYLLDANVPAVKVTNTGKGLVATFNVGGHDITILLGPGPFIERPDRTKVDVRLTVLFERALEVPELFEINNGY